MDVELVLVFRQPCSALCSRSLEALHGSGGKEHAHMRIHWGGLVRAGNISMKHQSMKHSEA